MFIAFEGLDGSGSSTQSKLLAERLEKNGKPSLLTKEPTSDTHVGKLIREILQHKWSISPEGLQLLFCADRAEHLKNIIEPGLKGGQVVISDRYLYSSLAYGGMSVDMEWLKVLNKNFRLPDITFLFKLSPAECIGRISGRGSHFELFERTDKLAKIWENYKKIAGEFPNIQLIDATKTIEEISEEIWKVVSENLD